MRHAERTIDTADAEGFVPLWPIFIKIARNKVVYSGAALNKWLSERVVTRDIYDPFHVVRF